MTESAPIVDSACTASPSGTLELSTRELTSSQGRALWAETLEETYCEMGVDWPTANSSFAADIMARSVGELSFSVVRADPHTVVRTPAMIESDPGDHYILCVITQGSATISQGDHTSTLSNGAFGLVDSSRPFIVSGETEFEQVVLRVSRDLIVQRVSRNLVDHSLGLMISAELGVGRLASRLLVDVATHDDHFTAGSWTAVSSAVLDLVSAAVGQSAPTMSHTDRCHAEDLRRVQRVMVRDMADPERTLGEVGVELGMSVRYIHNLFSATGMTPRSWLFARRFEKAQALLLQTDIACAAIAEQLGFGDVSHFSRAFSRHCGTSPSRYRAAHR